MPSEQLQASACRIASGFGVGPCVEDWRGMASGPPGLHMSVDRDTHQLAFAELCEGLA